MIDKLSLIIRDHGASKNENNKEYFPHFEIVAYFGVWKFILQFFGKIVFRSAEILSYPICYVMTCHNKRKNNSVGKICILKIFRLFSCTQKHVAQICLQEIKSAR